MSFRKNEFDRTDMRRAVFFYNVRKGQKKEVKRMKTYENLRTLSECAIMVALAFVLSLIKLFEMPFGGSVTLLSLLPICIVSIRHGIGWGLGTAFVYSVTQALVSGATACGLTPTVLVLCFLLDYILAFTVLGLAGLFRKRGMVGCLLGITLVCALRFLCHYVSGVTLWASWAPEGMNPYLYSLLYNGGFMLPETVMTVIGAFFVLAAMKKFLTVD